MFENCKNNSKYSYKPEWRCGRRYDILEQLRNPNYSPEARFFFVGHFTSLNCKILNYINIILFNTCIKSIFLLFSKYKKKTQFVPYFKCFNFYF